MRASRPVGPGSRLPSTLLLATLVVPTTPLEGQSTPGLIVRETVLENGLHVIAAPNSSVPIATIEVALRGGARSQLNEADEGLPHILEHMLFKSYERSGRDWWQRETGEIDATSNGRTGEETVAFFMTLPSEHLDKGIELLADLLRSQRFREDQLTEEKQVVVGELQRRASDPYFLADQVTDMALWGSAFRSRNPIGNMLTIMGASTDELEAHFERFYVPNNAALVVTGDIDPSSVFASAAEHFRRWERGRDPWQDFPHHEVPRLSHDSVFVVAAEASEVTLLVRWHGPAANEDRPATIAGRLYSELVSMPTSGTQRRLVDTGLFTGVALHYTHSSGVGPIGLVARTTPERLIEAARALEAELELLGGTDYFTAADLESAKKRLLVEASLTEETSIGLAHSLAEAWSVAGLDEYVGRAAALEAAGPDDVRAFVTRYLAGRPKVISFLMSDETLNVNADPLVELVMDWRSR